MTRTVTRRLPVRRWQKNGDSDVFIALTFRRPKTAPFAQTWGQVCSNVKPGLGVYLKPSLNVDIDPIYPFIDLFTERPVHPLEMRVTKMEKLRIVIDSYDPECQPLMLVNGGTIFSMVTLWLKREMMEVTEYVNYPISLRGGFESH